MSYSYECTEEGHSSGNIWTYRVIANDDSIVTPKVYYVKAISTSSVPNQESIWAFYDGIPTASMITQTIYRYAYNTQQSFSQNLSVESYAQSDVAYIRPYFVNSNISTAPPVNEVVTGTLTQLNDVTLHQGLALNARTYFDTPTSGSGTATVEIDIEGEQLTFESQMLGNTITRFIDDDAEVDMEE